jgi:5'-nucleotidase
MKRILISNDDGVASPGIHALADAVRDLGEVWIIAPDREQSAQSHALTMHKPLRAHEVGERTFGISGTPADCVYLGLHRLMPYKPDIVLSGINRGSNLGNDVFYSGTFAAAMEGCLQGVPSIAFSLHMKFSEEAFTTAKYVAHALTGRVLSESLPARVLLNVNIPSVPRSELKGIRPAVLGVREYEDMVDARQDPRGRPYYWIGGAHDFFAPIPDSDGPLVEQGWATVTPIRPDLTFHAFLPSLERWVQELP